MTTNSGNNEKKEKIEARKWSQILVFGPLYLLNLCFGMNSGYPAILTPQLSEHCSGLSITETEESWIVSMENLITPLFCLFSGYLQLKFGPKKVLIMTCIPYIGGWFLVHFANSVWMIYLSRIMVGFSNAFLTTTVYIIEVASTDLRGPYSLIESVIRCLGTVVVYAMGYALRWDYIALVSAGPPIFALILLFFVPESPVYLIKNGQISAAENAIKKCYGPHYDTASEVTQITSGLKRSENMSKSRAGVFGIFTRPEVSKPMIIVMFLSIVQQFSGLSIIRSYAVKIFDEVFQDDDELVNKTKSLTNFLKEDSVDPCDHHVKGEAYLAAILIGTMRLISSIMISKLMFHYRRRPLYMISAIMTSTSLVAFGICKLLLFNHFGTPDDHVIIQWTSLVSACVLVFGVQIGVQTFPLLLSGELFPSDVRPTCKSISRSFQYILLAGCLLLYPIFEHSKLHVHGTFFLFGAVIFVAMPIVYFVVPETKNISLELVQTFFTPQKTIFYVELNDEHNKK